MNVSPKAKLIIFDLDGTLAENDATVFYPEVQTWLNQSDNPHWMIATNQGGIGLRYWMETDGFGEPDKYPTLQSFEARLYKLLPGLLPNDFKFTVLMCARYQSKKSGKWCPVPEWGVGLAMWNEDWRKPAPGMLLHAMTITGVTPEQTLMVGDDETDQQAAIAAGCHFQWAWEFFRREKPVEQAS